MCPQKYPISIRAQGLIYISQGTFKRTINLIVRLNVPYILYIIAVLHPQCHKNGQLHISYMYIEPEQHINRNEQLSLIYIKQTALLLVQKSNMFSIKTQALFYTIKSYFLNL